MSSEKTKKTNRRRSVNKKERAEAKDKVRELFEADAEALEKAASRLAPDFDYEEGAEEVRAEDEITDEREAEKAELKSMIGELLKAEYARIESAAEEIAPDFDYEKAASELKEEDAFIDAVEVAAKAESGREAAQENAAGVKTGKTKRVRNTADEAFWAGPAEEAAKAEAEAKAKAEEEARAKAEAEAKAAEEKRLKEEAEEAERAKAAEEKRLKAEREAAEKAEKEAKAKAEREAKEAERKAKEEAKAAEKARKEEAKKQAEKDRKEAVRIEAEKKSAARKAAAAAAEEKRHAAAMKPEISPSKYPKEKKEPKTSLGRFFLRDKHRKTLGATFLLIIAALGMTAYDYLVPKDVNIAYSTYDGEHEFTISTKARTVQEVFNELVSSEDDTNGVAILDTDIVSPAGDTKVSDNMTVDIMHAAKATAEIAGSEQEIWLVPGTVEDNLSYNNVSYDSDDEISPELTETVSEDTDIVVDEVHYDVVEKTETVEAQDKVILDPSLTSGVQETTEGNDGEGIYTYTTKVINGEEQDTERELKEWITEPHDNTLRLGTSSTGNSGEYVVTRTFTANCTAYTAASGARGSLGETVHVGTCAVDPSYVPYRSQLWVEGYGYAYANDTGGAVKGNVVDLYMSSRSQCVSWGRRNMTAYVLQAVE